MTNDCKYGLPQGSEAQPPWPSDEIPLPWHVEPTRNGEAFVLVAANGQKIALANCLESASENLEFIARTCNAVFQQAAEPSPTRTAEPSDNKVTVEERWDRYGKYERKIGNGEWEELPNPHGRRPFVEVTPRSEWIPVSERLPKVFAPVLFVPSGPGSVVELGQLVENGIWRSERTDGYNNPVEWGDGCITHWREVPAPPSPDENSRAESIPPPDVKG